MSVQTAESMDTPIVDASNAASILSLGSMLSLGVIKLDAHGISANVY